MLSIPLATFYYIYLGLILGFFGFTFFNIYHLIRFGYLTIVTIVVTGFYLTISILILSISWQYIAAINWQQSIQLIPELNSII